MKKILVVFLILAITLFNPFKYNIVHSEYVPGPGYVTKFKYSLVAPDSTIHTFTSPSSVATSYYGTTAVARNYSLAIGPTNTSEYSSSSISYFRPLSDGRILTIHTYHKTVGSYGYNKSYKVWYSWNGSEYVLSTFKELENNPQGNVRDISGYGVGVAVAGGANSGWNSYAYYFNGSDLVPLSGTHYTWGWTLYVGSDSKVYLTDYGGTIHLSDGNNGPISWNGGSYTLSNYPFYDTMGMGTIGPGYLWAFKVPYNGLYWYYAANGVCFIPPEAFTNAPPTISLGFGNGITYYYNNNDDIWTWGTASDQNGDNIKVSATINGQYKETTVASGQTWYLMWDISTLPIQQGTYNNIQFNASDGKGGSSSVIFTGNFVVDKTAPTTPIIRYGY